MHYNEAETARKIKSGDIPAFEETCLRYGKELKHFALKLTRSEFVAEEAVQEVLVKLWTHREYLNPDAGMKSYLYKMVRNKALNYLRKEAHANNFKDLFSTQYADNTYHLEEEARFSELKSQFQEIIDKLPERKRKIYTLYQEGHGCKEIGEKLGMAEKTVYNNLTLISQAIRKNLDPLLSVFMLFFLY